MNKEVALFSLALLLSFTLALSSLSLEAAERLRLASAIKDSAVYYLPALAGEEKGIWKANGLDVEWVPFRSTATMHQASAGGSIQVGMDSTFAHVPAQARGLPTVMVSSLHTAIATALWVPINSRINSPSDLKGAKLGVTSFGGTGHALAILFTKALGVDKDVKYVAVGTIPAQMASLKIGSTDAMTGFYFTMLPLKDKGEVRPIADLEDYLKGQWISHVLYARRDFVKSSPETVSRLIKGVLASLDFLRKERAWAVAKMMSEQNISKNGAEEMYGYLKFATDGRISPAAAQNLANFLIEYGLVAKEKMPAAEELYTARFTG